ncbi:MAG: hypothetical protein Q8R28_18600 [Dehalococcoidia bacterium]|nr:hypothetical protein [Dehalococcoidia bacterium]
MPGDRKRSSLWLPVALFPVLALLAAYFVLPFSGEVLVITQGDKSQALLWPLMRLDGVSPGPDGKVSIHVTDVVPWAYVLVTVNGKAANKEGWSQNPGGTWTWNWTFVPGGNTTLPQSRELRLLFYRDCDTGCLKRGQLVVGGSDGREAASMKKPPAGLPTKLGVVFANPNRDWHGRTGWDVELTYARLPDEPQWGTDDLAARVHDASLKGIRVLVRVDYDRGQTLPPNGDYPALTEYLRYVRRLARDERLREVYGYVIGSGFNALDSSSLARDRAVSPGWYARVFNGYGEPASHTDNIVQTVRSENQQVRLLVGPVRPWNWDQSGARRYAMDVPWLNYMNTLVAALDDGTKAKGAFGIPLAAPDGFAMQVPGRPGAAEMNGRVGAEEPGLDLRRAAWQNARVGFRIYKDWLDIINSYDTTRGAPAYITSANTYAADDGVPPTQNYPRGWLGTAIEVIDREPQVVSLSWYLDGPLGDNQWDDFSLTRGSGALQAASEEFDALLQSGR